MNELRFSFDKGSRNSFFIVPLVIMILVGSIASGVLLYRQVSSLVAFRDAQVEMNNGSIPNAKAALIRANALSERDIYHRALSNVALLELGALPNVNLPESELATRANQYVAEARMHAEQAIALDSTNFENYLQLGGVYDTLGSLGIQNTSAFARENYEKALLLNPKSPRVLFVLARLELISGDRERSKEYLRLALVERPNFLEAISFLTQLEIQDKDPKAAIAVLSNGVNAEPTNFLLHFALGYLYYSERDYTAAVPEFEAAVQLNPVYADAKYFLGLSYARLTRRDEAIAQFVDVQTLNPDNQEVAQILKNLKAGNDPFDRGYVPPTQPVDDALSGLDRGAGSATTETP